MLVLIIVGVFVYLRVDSELSATLDDGLRTRADDLAALVASTGAADTDLSSGRLGERDEGFSQVVARDGRILDSSLPPGAGAVIDSEQLAAAAGGPVFFDREVPETDGEARVLARPARFRGTTVVVVAGASTEDRTEALAGLLGAFLVGAPVALLVASLLGYLLARRSLAPVEAMRRRAADITLERSDERLPLPAAEDEVKRLGTTLNAMLDRLEASLERERVFVADASHELRTPLAVVRAELELAQRPGRSAREMRAALISASDEVDRLTQLAEDLLVIARSENGRLSLRCERGDLAELLAQVRSRFKARAEREGRSIFVDAPAGLEADFDALRLEQALGNLVENALRHGSGEIRLSARGDGDLRAIEVADRGDGFPAGFEDSAFERFTRGDPGRAGGGAGLGLAIARAVARAHGGEARVLAAAGGATIRIDLPAFAPPT